MPEVRPAASFAVIECVPAASVLEVQEKVPVADEVTVQRVVVPSETVTRLAAVAPVPEITGVVLDDGEAGVLERVIAAPVTVTLW